MSKRPVENADDILLGKTSETESGFGFVSAVRKQSNSLPINYSGPHMTTVAPTGAGKGVCAAIPTLLEYPGQVIALDIKGELYSTTSRRRRAMGQRVIKLDPFQILGEDTDALNPLDILKLPGADLETDCETLAKILSGGKESARDPFWHLTANGLNSGALMYIGACEEEQNRNLIRMAEMIHGDDTAYSIAVLLDSRGSSMPPAAYRELSAFLGLPDRETRPSTLATAQSFMKCLMSNRIAQTLRSTSFDLEDLRSGQPLTIYIVIPPDRLASHSTIVALWIGTLIKVIFSRKQAPHLRTLALIDEAAALGNFPMLEAAITLCRSYGLRVWSFWQDIQQIQASFPTGWRTMLNNSGLQVFGVNSKLMATDLSHLIEFPPSELLAMDDQSQILQLPGSEPRVCTRINYLHDKRYQGLFDENRFHAHEPKSFCEIEAESRVAPTCSSLK